MFYVKLGLDRPASLLSVIDASAINSLHCFRSSAMLHNVVLSFPDVFPNLVGSI